MQIAKYVVLGLYVIVCIALIILATVQTKETAGASATITGSSTNNFFEKNKGRTKEGKLKRWTIIFGVLFIVLAIALQEKIPEAKIVLVESITKKTVYLKDVCGCLGLTNVEVINNRAENIVFKNADYITARAVATIDKIYNFTKTIYSKNTRYLLLKGKSGNEELQEARKKWTFKVNSFANKYCADGYLYEIFDLRKIKWK